MLNNLTPLIAILVLMMTVAGDVNAQQTQSLDLHLMSPAFSDGGRIPKPYVCENSKNFSRHSPVLTWTGKPEGTRSFVVIFHDAEVSFRKGSEDILHWIIWNIPATATGLPEKLPAETHLPDGSVQGENVTGQVGYLGPCAPAGLPHHYTFDLYALDINLDLAPTATRADVMAAMDGHVIGKSVLIGLFNQ